MKKAILAGSTGLVGSELLRLLMDFEEYSEIHLLLRRPLHSKHDKIKEHLINFDELENLSFEYKIDDFYCALGTTMKKAGSKQNFRKVDCDYIVNLGKVAKKLNVEKFLLVSAVGADPKSAIFYSRVKGETEDALKDLNLNGLHIFRPSLIYGERNETRYTEKIGFYALNVLSPIMIGPFKKYRAVSGMQIAKAMLQHALNEDEKVKIIESDEIIEY